MFFYNQSKIVEISSSLYIFFESIFALAQLIFVVAIVTDVSMVLSAI